MYGQTIKETFLRVEQVRQLGLLVMRDEFVTPLTFMQRARSNPV